jgi:hypothetical protein
MSKNLYNLKVAKLVSPYEVIINAGYDDDVTTGMEFVIFALGEEVFDPDNKESLGHIEIVKGSVAITHVQDRMAKGTSNRFTGSALSPPRTRIQLDDVQVGDLARRTA